MPTTPTLLLPYPLPGDPADVPLDLQELADRIEAVRGIVNGLASLGADGKVPAAQLPALSAFAGCRAVANAGLTVPHATATPVPFQVEEFDVGGFHDPAVNPSRFTIPAGLGGYYAIDFVGTYDGNATGVRDTHLRKNGVSPAAQIGYSRRDGSASGTTVGLAVVIQLVAGDYVEVVVYQSSGASNGFGVADPFRPQFSIVKVG